ncbi:HRDC domain-containing protein [Deinococcus aerophilus]|uniref:Membrane protein n=1 Tax=Deinococcus aerophilus TaxID=522488 RepID=A0ABQ2GP04_9DEIO|nr:HRDC domain-containing protein [Deinococcus aerophilus]GGM04216.1 membrane protein [Deinococcus aerophilus]
MTDSRHSRPDARLVRLHAERGDPHARLAGALAALEGAEWGLLLPGEAALARQLAAMLGQGTLRVDSRLRLNRDLLAVAGLAAAPLDGDWRGARGVWLLEPEAADLERARRAGVRVIADATLAPGGGWLQAGADLIVYRDGATLTGHGDVPLAVLFGAGQTPDPVTSPPSELSVALALRDVATLPLRLARAARTVAALTDRLGGAAQPAGPTALLLAPDAAPDTDQPLGGVLAATRSVPAGVLLTPGLEEPDAALALLERMAHGAVSDGPSQGDAGEGDARKEDHTPAQGAPETPRREHGEPRSGRRDDRRDRGGRRDSRPDGRRGDFRREDQPDQTDRPSEPDAPARPAPERFVFESSPDASAAPEQPAEAESMVPSSAEEIWEPEIVYSDLSHPPVRLPTPISSGPDSSTLEAGVPDVRHQADHSPGEEPDAPREKEEGRRGRAQRTGQRAEQRTEPTYDAAPADETPVVLPPDLPAAREDPATDLTDEQAAVYARLREWRNAEAKRQEISRFIVASNATLAEIARRVPYTEADLKAVKGMGPERLRKYGEKILEVVRG